MATGVSFAVKDHTLPAQHVREHDNGVANEHDDYFIHIKQYTPLIDGKAPPQQDGLTVIGAAGIGMIKEVYEPFFHEITTQCLQRGVSVRGFWIADMGCVGKSALANAKNLGNDQSWFDHSRDLLAMVNHFRKEMPRPLVGLGHSMGGCQIAHLSLLHPRLFHTLLLVEPAIYPGLARETSLAQTRAMTRRREYWPTLAEAEADIRKNPFYNRWHPRAISLLVENSLVKPVEDTPVAPSVPANNTADGVVTTTPRNMEVALIFKPNYRGVGTKGLDAMSHEDRFTAPNINPGARWIFPFYRPEPSTVLSMLPSIQPSVCYILGGDSASSVPELRKMRLDKTGTGVGGSGGARLGRVVERVIPGGGHYISFDRETMPQTAAFAAEWLESEMCRFHNDRERSAEWRRMPGDKRTQPDKVMIDALAEWHPKKSPDIERLVKSRL